MLDYNAAIVSKLLFGLESLERTDPTASLLNTFQLKGCRKVEKITHDIHMTSEHK